jgi:hypothetical protein
MNIDVVCTFGFRHLQRSGNGVPAQDRETVGPPLGSWVVMALTSLLFSSFAMLQACGLKHEKYIHPVRTSTSDTLENMSFLLDTFPSPSLT